MAVSPFRSPRPASYPHIPTPIHRGRARDLKLPPGPRSLTLTLRFQKDTPGFLRDVRDQYGQIASFYLGRELFIAAFDPAMVHEVTVSKQRSFIKGVGFDRMRKVLGTGLLTNEEPIHLRHRRLMQAPFHINRISNYSRTMLELTRKHLNSWRINSTVEIGPEMMALTFDIVADILFGTDIKDDTQAVQESMHIAIDRIERTMLPGLEKTDYLPLPYFKRFERAADRLHHIATRIVEERIRSDVKRDDLLGLLLESETSEGEKLSESEISDETLTLILSGHETTANVLTWTFAYLDKRPDLWKALSEEANTILAQSESDDFARIIFAAPIVSAVFNEVLRLAPPVWVAPRRAITDVLVGDTDIPKGAHVLISQYVTHRDPRYFSSPDSFIPERWFNDFEKSLPDGAYFPFGAGTRKCLGDQFALLEGRIIILEIARRFKLQLIGDFPKAQPRATYRPRGGVAMRVSEVQN
ncbi:MAG: cytochrome P450 [Candidatus Nanopelagicaceae bacterium]